MRSLLLLLAFTACSGPLDPGAVLVPPCWSPAPLLGSYTPGAPLYFIRLESGVDVTQEANRLARRYGFTVVHVYWTSPTFTAALDSRVVAQVRCERTVRYLEYDGIGTLAD